jgi:hypothetical protein
MIYILILYGLISLISYVATAAIMGKFKKGGEKNESKSFNKRKRR